MTCLLDNEGELASCSLKGEVVKCLRVFLVNKVFFGARHPAHPPGPPAGALLFLLTHS